MIVCFSFQDDTFLTLRLLKQFPPHFVEVKRSPSKEVSERRDFPSVICLGRTQHCFLTFMGYQGIGPRATSRGYKVIRSMRVWLAKERKHHLDIIILVGSRPEVCDFTPRWKDKLITEMETRKTSFQNQHLPASLTSQWKQHGCLPSCPQCWCEGESERGRRSCDWSLCWPVTAVSPQSKDSKLSSPIPRKKELETERNCRISLGGRFEKQCKKSHGTKVVTSERATWCFPPIEILGCH